MKRYRFYTIVDDKKSYLSQDRHYSYFAPHLAGLFTEQDWEQWGEQIPGLQRELPDDQAMADLGRERAPLLPGLE